MLLRQSLALGQGGARRSLFSAFLKRSQSTTAATTGGGTAPPSPASLKHEKLQEYGRYLMSIMPGRIDQVSVYKDEIKLDVSKDNLLHVARVLRDHTMCQFKQLIDVVGVDYPQKKDRFTVIYPLLSLRFGTRLSVATTTDDLTPIPSLTSLYNSANWGEREVYDLFGVVFEGHPDLRRILTDYGFEGHPLRKDFPLTGFVEVRYDDEKKRVVTEPLEMTQEFRRFEFGSPWEQVPGGKTVEKK